MRTLRISHSLKLFQRAHYDACTCAHRFTCHARSLSSRSSRSRQAALTTTRPSLLRLSRASFLSRSLQPPRPAFLFPMVQAELKPLTHTKSLRGSTKTSRTGFASPSLEASHRVNTLLMWSFAKRMAASSFNDARASTLSATMCCAFTSRQTASESCARVRVATLAFRSAWMATAWIHDAIRHPMNSATK